MILVTGGLGFIGSHTVDALLELGHECLVTQHSAEPRPEVAGNDRIAVERIDVSDPVSLRAAGERHRITGIVHLAGAPHATLGVIDELAANMNILFNIGRLAQEWGVGRVVMASTIGVYAGAEAASPPDQDGKRGESVPLREDLPLPMTAIQPIQGFKKAAEILSTLLGGRDGVEFASARISAAWGPLGRPKSMFFSLPRMVHAAVAGEVADFSGDGSEPVAYAGDGLDMTYVKDCGRALALLVTVPELRYRTYNVGSGHATSTGEVAEAIRAAIPTAAIVLAEGGNPGNRAPNVSLDISRLRADTGFEPGYDLASGLGDYIAWLRAGHQR
ncbi:MAG TPA: NAD(P)-dependent oxidoreductase [Micromonosporaceae bacterium]